MPLPTIQLLPRLIDYLTFLHKAQHMDSLFFSPCTLLSLCPFLCLIYIETYSSEPFLFATAMLHNHVLFVNTLNSLSKANNLLKANNTEWNNTGTFMSKRLPFSLPQKTLLFKNINLCSTLLQSLCIQCSIKATKCYAHFAWPIFLMQNRPSKKKCMQLIILNSDYFLITFILKK